MCARHRNGPEARAVAPFHKLSSLIMHRPLSESFVFPMVFQHFQQVLVLSSADDRMHRSLNCKCKSEDAGPWGGHGLEPEWARSAARFCSESFIFIRFLKGLATPAGCSYFVRFPCVFDDFRWRICQTPTISARLPKTH